MAVSGAAIPSKYGHVSELIVHEEEHLKVWHHGSKAVFFGCEKNSVCWTSKTTVKCIQCKSSITA